MGLLFLIPRSQILYKEGVLMYSRGMLLSFAVVGLCTFAQAASDAEIQALVERVKKLESKNQELETKLHTATAAMEKRKGVETAVDKAIATSEKMGAVVTAPDATC